MRRAERSDAAVRVDAIVWLNGTLRKPEEYGSTREAIAGWRGLSSVRSVTLAGCRRVCREIRGGSWSFWIRSRDLWWGGPSRSYMPRLRQFSASMRAAPSIILFLPQRVVQYICLY